MTTAQDHLGYFYGDPANPSKDRISYRRNTAQPVFNIGQNFESTDFSVLATSFDQAIRDRLHQLKNSGRYTRFWFSGGKDSRLILDRACQEGVHFNEIVIIKNQILGPMYHLGAIVEIQANAVDYIHSIQHLLPNTKITIVDFEDQEYQLVYSHADWINQTNNYYIHSAIEPQLFYKYVNPVLNYLEDIPDRIDLMGCVYPHVYWNEGWCFTYIDLQFPQNLWHTCENFLTSANAPELAHAYVVAVCQELERRNLRPYRFQKDIYSDTNQNLRSVRDLLPEYQFEIYRPDHEWPKSYQDPWRPSQDSFWKANPSYKSFLSCMLCYFAGDKSQGFVNYRDQTDWSAVLGELKYGGILSREFRL